jgi:hypothetical protein
MPLEVHLLDFTGDLYGRELEVGREREEVEHSRYAAGATCSVAAMNRQWMALVASFAAAVPNASAAAPMAWFATPRCWQAPTRA